MAELAADTPLLEVSGLRIEYVAGSVRSELVTTVDLQVGRGETVALVGESGSGKSLTARAIMRLLPDGVEAVAGKVMYGGDDVLALSERDVRKLRGGQISMILQDPFTMLNPVTRCGKQIEEVLRSRATSRLGKRELRAESIRRLAEVGITDETAVDRYPFQLSGGMRQRVAIAAALAGDPQLLIADEPSTALDVTTQAEILDLLRSIQEARDMGLILITHDLRVAFSVAQRIYVLYAGSLVEVGATAAVEHEPLHPYSLGLLLSEPATNRRTRRLVAIEGAVPGPAEVADRCSFEPRCRWATAACIGKKPALEAIDGGRLSACVRIGEIRAAMTSVRLEAVQSEEVHGPEGTGVIDPLLRVDDLRKVFVGRLGNQVNALRGVSIEVGRGESVGLVGESGSGKTTLGRCLVGLETPTSGTIEIDGTAANDYRQATKEQRAKLRSTVQIVFQDPYSSLDRTESVGTSLREVLSVNGYPRDQIGARIEELLGRVGLPQGYAKRRPAALSGGERQRVAIARTLAVEPQLLVCDEPVSALDVSVQAQILNLFRDLRDEFGLGYLFITHDLAVVRQVVDRIYVLHEGLVVEHGPVEQVFEDPQHWYTEKLIASIPRSAS